MLIREDTNPVNWFTHYVNGLVVESKSVNSVLQYSDKPQFFGQEEGRVRIQIPEDNTDPSFQFDYFLKDHLGNVRMVLTDEEKQDKYPAATLETANLSTEQLYYNIPTDAATRVNKSTVTSYPTDNTTSPNDYIQKLSGSGTKIGSSITLKVMAGDKVNLKVSSWYKKSGASPGTPVNTLPDLLTALINGVGGSAAPVHGGTIGTQLQTNAVLTPGATQFLSSQTVASGKPKAFLNWVLFDEQFKLVSTSSSVDPVGDDEVFKSHVVDGISRNKSGYLYVYVSNETPNINVFFDNLQVTQLRGPVVEETHYYPFGLTMAGISSKAAVGLVNNRKWNKGSELESKEFSDGSGLELYSTFYRSLDPQIGRFWQIDPKPNYEQSLYSSMGNNPILYNDPMGDTARIHFRRGFLGLGGKKQVDYNGGKLTNTDGSAYTGKVNGFLKQAVKGLDRISSGGTAGKSLVNEIVTSKETVNIIQGSGNSFNANDKVIGMKNVVKWDPSNKTGGPDATLNQSRPSFIGFGHELAHAQDQISDGKVDYSTWYTTSSGYNVPNAEKYSTHIENRLRSENGLNLRAFYSIGQNSVGATVGEGSIIIPGTRSNANYPLINNPIMTTLGIFPLPYNY